MTALPEPVDLTDFPASVWQSIKRAMKGKCPNCGKGHLWQKYIKQVDECNKCYAQLGEIRADDGPAWLTILIVGHVWSPLLVIVTRYSIPMWILFPSLLIGATLSCIAILPTAKAVFLGALWRTKAGDQSID